MSKKANFFWASYADLMTSLFFIMLVLFILTVAILKRKERELVIQLEAFKKIEEIKKSLNEIDTNYFEYRNEYKKHIFKLKVKYEAGNSNIKEITDMSLLPKIENAGNKIYNTIAKFTHTTDIQYLVIIEGQASMDPYPENDVLSYKRALGLNEFWKSRGINLQNLKNCELIIAGSGVGGIPRDPNNEKNQRFLIHIIPKTGTITTNHTK